MTGMAPKYAGQDKVSPGSVILSGVMMLEHMGWNEAARMIEKGMEAAIAKGTVTDDFARQMKEEGRTDVTEIKCSEFGTARSSRICNKSRLPRRDIWARPGL